eukprot:Clim_evm11s218 gene=Clim_evmTU11s218
MIRLVAGYATGQTAKFAAGKSVSDRKSVFQGFLTHCTDIKRVSALLAELRNSDRKLSKASHFVWAARVQSKLPGALPDIATDDAGETGAGGRLLKILEHGGYDNVLLVVLRWYGGVPLGGARYRHISNCGVSAIEVAKASKMIT